MIKSIAPEKVEKVNYLSLCVAVIISVAIPSFCFGQMSLKGMDSDAITYDSVNKSSSVSPSKKQSQYEAGLAEIYNKNEMFVKGQVGRMSKIRDGLDKNSLTTIIKPSRMVEKKGIEEARSQLRYYSSLILERDAFYASLWKESALIGKNSSLGIDDKKLYLDVVEENRSSHYALSNAMSLAENHVISQMYSVLNFAEKNIGHISISEGRLIFDSEDLLKVYKEQQMRLQKAWGEVYAATAGFSKFKEMRFEEVANSRK